jgi:type IV pilus assembly protein PilA
MKSFFVSLKRQDGFTLVELMVVVAIIGLLSAVAVPNFKKYQAKAKISEAKLQLAAVYTAESSFFSDYNIYHNCLAYMGFDPGLESANRYYVVGFNLTSAINSSAYSAATNSGLNATDCPAANGAVTGGTSAASTNPATWFPAGKGVGSVIASTTGYLPTTALGIQDASGTMTYTAGAGGVISQDFTPAASASALTINQAKVLSITRNGF